MCLLTGIMTESECQSIICPSKSSYVANRCLSCVKLVFLHTKVYILAQNVCTIIVSSLAIAMYKGCYYISETSDKHLFFVWLSLEVDISGIIVKELK